MLSRVQVIVDHRRFESPPIIGPSGPLPHGGYRFEYLSLFNAALGRRRRSCAAPRVGKRLHGPGITRDRIGEAAFFLVEDRTL